MGFFQIKEKREHSPEPTDVSIDAIFMAFYICIERKFSSLQETVIYLFSQKQKRHFPKSLPDLDTKQLSHPEAEPKDEDEEGALTGHPRNPTHVAPFSGGLPNVLGDTLGKELTEEPSVPEPLPAPRITNNILGDELTEEPSVPEPLPATHITNDILEEALIEEPSMLEPLPAPRITNDIL
ncbi:uncharacterized protein LOC128322743 isoform X2 [Hemicordylus capensis]|uniref:uncharacterized protein LOC128322743 isoform X2 n=1 Tax=Hemicordylus capensis TaxID=884348 RepID=UPI0023026DDE|nr:uncharacterized protein LOC128322743 isoform X2 [Hemicordylus capensis]XP_053100610.1 uncharacterized protein LOC128322743 isoform X2 [Hemicordylus capensis]XP_053100611.1 uncharacterized protein LOC128322743 isoform X2 [Hemicordylus capensis]